MAAVPSFPGFIFDPSRSDLIKYHRLASAGTDLYFLRQEDVCSKPPAYLFGITCQNNDAKKLHVAVGPLINGRRINKRFAWVKSGSPVVVHDDQKATTEEAIGFYVEFVCMDDEFETAWKLRQYQAYGIKSDLGIFEICWEGQPYKDAWQKVLTAREALVKASKPLQLHELPELQLESVSDPTIVPEKPSASQKTLLPEHSSSTDSAPLIFKRRQFKCSAAEAAAEENTAEENTSCIKLRSRLVKKYDKTSARVEPEPEREATSLLDEVDVFSAKPDVGVDSVEVAVVEGSDQNGGSKPANSFVSSVREVGSEVSVQASVEKQLDETEIAVQGRTCAEENKQLAGQLTDLVFGQESASVRALSERGGSSEEMKRRVSQLLECLYGANSEVYKWFTISSAQEDGGSDDKRSVVGELLKGMFGEQSEVLLWFLASAGSNKAASSSTSVNTRKLDDETDERVPSELKRAIMQARTDKKLSQTKLAKMINEKPQTIKEYESGKAIPTQQIINKLESALGVKLLL